MHPLKGYYSKEMFEYLDNFHHGTMFAEFAKILKRIHSVIDNIHGHVKRILRVEEMDSMELAFQVQGEP
jgi:hypothetical protein